MQKAISQSNTYRLGIYGAIATIIGIILSGPLSMVVVALIRPQPLWENARLFTENYHPIQAMPYYAGFFLVIGSATMVAAIYHIAEEGQKAQALLALIFTAVFATLIFFNYINQTTFIGLSR